MLNPQKKIFKLYKHNHALLVMAIGNSRWFIIDGVKGDVQEERLFSIEEIASITGNPDILYMAERCGIFEESKLKQKEMIYPYHLGLNVTYNCNLRCKYCYNAFRKSDTGMSQALAIDVIRQAMELSKRPLTVIVAGGEPLLCFDLLRNLSEYFAKDLDSKKLFLQIQTNGLLIDNKVIDMILKYHIHVSLSLDEPFKNEFTLRYHKESELNYFNSVHRSIKLLEEKGIDFGVVSIMNKNNISFLPQLLEYFIEHAVKRFSFNFCYPIGAGANNKNDIIPDVSDVIKLSKHVISRIIELNTFKSEKKFIERNIGFLVKNITSSKREFMCLSSPCGAGVDTISVNPDGSVEPCVIFGDAFTMGNVKEERLKAILDRREIESMQYNRRTDEIDGCEICCFNNICNGGGCGAATYRITNSFFSKGIWCDYYKEIIPHICFELFEKKLEPSIFYSL